MSAPPAYGATHPGPYDGGAPVCPRHPDRVSYVRCQRCGRPACTQCQRPAAVGVQCVDCVAQQARSVRSGRTSFGGVVRAGRSSTLVTITLIVLCCLAWVGEQVAPQVFGQLAFAPVRGWSQPWRIVTGGFLHATGFPPLHLGLNMLSLWFLGSYLEPMLGRVRFLALYLVSLVGGAAAIVLLSPAPTGVAVCGAWCTPTIGASGAIFGLFGALLLVNRGLGRSNAGMWPALLVNAVYSFTVSNVSWQGHVGGFVTGLLCGVVLWRLQGPARRWHVGAMAGIAVLLLAVCAIKYAGVPPLLR